MKGSGSSPRCHGQQSEDEEEGAAVGQRELQTNREIFCAADLRRLI